MNARTVTLALAAALSFAGAARAQPNLKATYLFNDTLAAEKSGPPQLVSVDPLGVNGVETATVFDQTRRVFHWSGDPGLETAGGLSLDATGLVPSDDYSIELVFSFANPAGWCSSAGFDARTVDAATVTVAQSGAILRASGAPLATVEDVNGDGRPDLVVHIVSETLRLTAADTEAVLEGTAYPGGALSRPFGGRQIRGVDSVRVVL